MVVKAIGKANKTSLKKRFPVVKSMLRIFENIPWRFGAVLELGWFIAFDYSIHSKTKGNPQGDEPILKALLTASELVEGDRNGVIQIKAIYIWGLRDF